MTEQRPPRARSPWTQEQVDILNRYQVAGRMHPFTCANRSEGHPFRDGDYGVLVATVDGWTCPDCDYTQDWAHTFMLDPAMGEPYNWPDQ